MPIAELYDPTEWEEMALGVSASDLASTPSAAPAFPLAEWEEISIPAVTPLAKPTVTDYSDIISRASEMHGVDSALIKSVIKAESNFNPKAVSKAGAQGLTQLMPNTAKELGVVDPFDPEENIMAGVKYLSQNLERFGGDVSLALAAFNAGPGNVEEYGDVPPFPETQTYIGKVLESYEKYKKPPMAPPAAPPVEASTKEVLRAIATTEEPPSFMEEVIKPTLKEIGRGMIATPETAYSLLEGMIVWPISKVAGLTGLIAGEQEMKRREEATARWLTHKPIMKKAMEAGEVVGKGFEFIETPQRIASEELEGRGYHRAAYLTKLVSDLAMFKILHAVGTKAKGKIIGESIPKDVPVSKEAIDQIAEVLPSIKEPEMVRPEPVRPVPISRLTETQKTIAREAIKEVAEEQRVDLVAETTRRRQAEIERMARAEVPPEPIEPIIAKPLVKPIVEPAKPPIEPARPLVEPEKPIVKPPTEPIITLVELREKPELAEYVTKRKKTHPEEVIAEAERMIKPEEPPREYRGEKAPEEAAAFKLADELGLRFESYVTPEPGVVGAGYMFSLTEKADPLFRGKEDIIGTSFSVEKLSDLPTKAKTKIEEFRKVAKEPVKPVVLPEVPRVPIPEKPAVGLALRKGEEVSFSEYREIKRGKNKGRVRVTWPDGKWSVIDKADVVRWPEKVEIIPEKARPRIFRMTEPTKVVNTRGKEITLPRGEEFMAYDIGKGKIRLQDGKQVTIYEGELSKLKGRMLPPGEKPIAGGMGRIERIYERTIRLIKKSKKEKGSKKQAEAAGLIKDELNDAYEKQEDIWFKKTDSRLLHADVEKRLLQKELKTELKTKRYGKVTRNIDHAIQIYIDTKRNPKHIKEYWDKLTPEQQKTVTLSQNLPDAAKKVADKIDKSYQEIGLEALDAQVIRNTLDNYAARIWDLSGKETKEQYRKFGIKTHHAKRRKLDTIIEGWANGLNLKVSGATNNLHILKHEIIKTIEDKRFLNVLKETTDIEGNPLITTKRPEEYKRVEHPNFTTWKWTGTAAKITSGPHAGEYKTYGKNFFVSEGGALLEQQVLYAPEKQAKYLNNVLGVSKLKKVPGIHTITKYNALTKAWILQTSFFHHLAFARSYYFGTQGKKWSELNIKKAYKEGLEGIENLQPEIKLGVENGLTLGLKQDWSETLLREKTLIGKWLDKTKATKAVKDSIINLRERQAEWLFGEFGAGLKAKSFLIEYRHQLKKYPNTASDILAKRVARLINDDFGGLHLRRLRRNPTLQHIFRLFALAPDWCCDSITRAMTKTGWKYHHELKIGDEIMAFDPETKKLKWSAMKDMYVNKDYNGKMIQIKNFNRCIMMTPEHTCYVYNSITKRNDIVKAHELQTNHQIPRCANFNISKTETYDDFLIQMVGWLVTDGHVKTSLWKRKDGTFQQKGLIKQAKPHTVQILRDFGLHYYVDKSNCDHDKFISRYPAYVFTIPESTFIQIKAAGVHRGLSWEFLNKLTYRQLQLLYDTMFLGDGTGQKRFCGKEKEVFYMTLIQTMLGLPSTFYQQEKNCWRTRWITRSNGISCWGHHNNKVEINYTGTIWCPSVNTGFWLAEREGLIFITGNTESNVRTMVKAIRSGEAAESRLYRRFWAGVLVKGGLATVTANWLMAGGDLEEMKQNYIRAWRVGNLKILGVDITPIYKLLGGSSEDRKYFTIFGHFRDPLKFIIHPIRSAHHKGSVAYGVFHEALAGTDWKGHKFTTISELIQERRTVKWGPGGPINWEQFPSYLLSQIIGMQPIQVQNLIAWAGGEVEGFNAVANSLGLAVTTGRVKGPVRRRGRRPTRRTRTSDTSGR